MMPDQQKKTGEPGRAPLFEALEMYRLKRKASFHVPGHKAGAAYVSDPTAAAWAAIGEIDATELNGLDDLHAPSGAILEAQSLAAACFGAERTYFLVGGSTVGNLSALHAVAGAGDVVVMQRNAHKSAIHALMLSGASAVFALPERNMESGLAGGIGAEAVREALTRNPEAKAVFVTNPSYYGVASNLAPLASAAHAFGVPLIVDEAHGAHFGFHPRFPSSALSLGADVVIQSTHKMLSAMTMGAMLHVQGERVDRERLEAYLRMLQSSSPSYPILASLDWSRRALHVQGARLFEPSLAAIDGFAMRLSTGDIAGGRFGLQPTDDPMKLLLFDVEGGLSGLALQEALTEEGVYIEMADERYAVCACSAATTGSDLSELERALSEIASRKPAEKKEIRHFFTNTNLLRSPVLSEPIRFRLGDDRAASGREVGLEDAAGEICDELVIPYPPGIPLLYPGERIGEETVATLLRLRAEGASIQGAADRQLLRIRVRDGNRFDS
ncbi:aminotransferase class I/II-fold pyridoxal phosphate-dependent enzyme [Paenibacillus sp. TRM 82003]|nr:aminotransferase class I/II-fold pyridoxal phosphate-dependent enzyme [Paenibacillus sp. TRM 82003]